MLQLCLCHEGKSTIAVWGGGLDQGGGWAEYLMIAFWMSTVDIQLLLISLV